MAPQQTFYGSVPMETQKEDRPSRFLRRALVVTGVVVLVSLAVFAASSSLHKPSVSVDVEELVDLRKAHEGDDLVKWKPDCQCRFNTCPSAANPNQKTYCGVLKHNCMGEDYGPAIDQNGNSVRENKKIDCKGGTNDGNSACRAVCSVVVGKNQCSKFPCMNGGWCKDLTDGFKCFCRTGWTGDTCAVNIDECDNSRATKVCHDKAICKDSPGKYSCECPKKAWYGYGYAASAPEPTWMKGKKAATKGLPYGCLDVNDCATKMCKNNGVCNNAEGKVNGWSCTCRKRKRLLVGKVVKLNNPKAPSLYVTGPPPNDCSQDVDECKAGTHDCDDNARCINQVGGTGDGFTCSCKPHWKSVDPAGQDHHGRIGRIHVTGTATAGANTAGYVAGCYDIDDCNLPSGNPCDNGGTCSQTYDGCVDPTARPKVVGDCFTCACKVGWSGKVCEKDENECENPKGGTRTKTEAAKCANVPSATCINTAGSFGCRCNLGWTGDPNVKCVDANDCEFNPCAHGGTCNDCGTLCFACNCVVGWRGATCGTDWNECLMGIHRCDDAATCVNTPGSYTCKCDPGYTGNGVGSAYVQEIRYTLNGKAMVKKVQHGCKDIDDCDPKEYDGTGKIAGWQRSWFHGPCKYGTCTDAGAGAYNCKCWDGWTDSNCDTNINECDSTTGSSECSHFATCQNLPGKGNPSATSPVPLPGARCDAATSPFNSHKLCRLSGMGGAKRKGTKCADADATKCTKEECCDVPSLYSCSCKKGFVGDGFSCFDHEDCTQNSCSGRGFCSDLGVDQFKCSCDKGWEDSDCSKNVNECADFTHECGTDALCVDTVGSYKCKCPKGFQPKGLIGAGAACTDIDDCGGASKMGKCRAGNTVSCQDGGVDLYTCVCKGGWTDYNCNFDINECKGDHDCWQGTPEGSKSKETHHRGVLTLKGQPIRFQPAKCINTAGGYKCQCPKGMIGRGRKTSKQETVTNGAYRAFKPKHKKGEEMVQKLPEGCVDFDDCRSAGADKMWHTNDEGEGPLKNKCSEADENRGKCVDTGAKSFRCDCLAGWGCDTPMCDSNCDECKNGANKCSVHAKCTDKFPKIVKGKNQNGYSCACNYPAGHMEGGNKPGYFGDGLTCSPCTECPLGSRPKGICKWRDRACVDVNECADNWTEKGDHGTSREWTQLPNPCDNNAQCLNSVGSFSCKCKRGFFASTPKRDARKTGPNRGGRGCRRWTVCREGFHTHAPGTPTTDRVCKRDVENAYVPANEDNTGPFDRNTLEGSYLIKTEADENLQCLTIRDDSWFPSRVDYGKGGQCGVATQDQWKKKQPEFVWSFTGLGDNTPKDAHLGRSNLYLIRYQGKTGKCLFFGNDGKALYPSLQHCKDTYKNGGCPWGSPSEAYCGYTGGRPALLRNMQAVWKVTTLKLSERKFILQSAARGKKSLKGKPLFECLVFEKQGMATNPTRYNWGNGEQFCGVGNWGDDTLKMAVMNNKQAVFILDEHVGWNKKVRSGAGSA